MPSWIDGTLYPDTDTPAEVGTLAEKVDFLARLCAVWDFGGLPRAETVAEIRRPEWREAVDACRVLTPATYHLVCSWHNLPQLPYLGRELAYIRDDPNLAYVLAGAAESQGRQLSHYLTVGARALLHPRNNHRYPRGQARRPGTIAVLTKLRFPSIMGVQFQEEVDRCLTTDHIPFAFAVHRVVGRTNQLLT
jgi:hypothetical protein